MKVLLPMFYLPNVTWFAEFLKKENEVVIEQWESFPKQTFRNRTAIYGANGKLLLIIPINHQSSKLIKDVEVSYAEDWQKIHWKSIKSCYQNSPYFEYYESQLKKIYDHKTTSLFDFNLNALQIVLRILKESKDFSLSIDYEKQIDGLDFRNHFSAKGNSESNSPEYYQTFSDKLGFIKNLSVLDLICNLGPESISYLENI